MHAGTFGFGCLGLRFLLFLFVLGTLISIPVCLALLGRLGLLSRRCSAVGVFHIRILGVGSRALSLGSLLLLLQLLLLRGRSRHGGDGGHDDGGFDGGGGPDQGK